MNNFLLDILSIGAVISAILVVLSKNPVISVLYLISVFVNVAGYLVIMGIGFIGISYLIVYIGAVTVLFLFVIIILNLQQTELNQIGNQYTKNLPLSTILGAIYCIELFTAIPSIKPNYSFIMYINEIFLNNNNNSNITNVFSVYNNINADNIIFTNLQIESLGFILYTSNSIWLIISAIILLLAIVGPIVLSLSNKTSE